MILLVDGYNLIFRSFYGMPDLRRSDGFPTNAIHGWVRTLWYLQDMKGVERMIVFFDDGADEREALLPEYKSNRGATPEDLVPQIPIIKRLTVQMGLQCVEQPGCEADDLIGSYAKHLGDKDLPGVIVSADKDLGQSVGGSIRQLLPPPTANPRLGWRMLDAEGVEKKFGVKTSQVADYLALVGDTSDNIPGLPGVGPKTAAKWLVEYGDIATIIAKANYLMPARFQSVVAERKEDLVRNLQLTRLNLDLAVDIPDTVEARYGELLDEFNALEMNKAYKDAQTRYNISA